MRTCCASRLRDLGLALVHLSPLLAPFVLFFGGGLALAVLQSLNLFLPGTSGGFSLAAWSLLAEPHVWASLAYSGWVALASALGATALGAVLAYGVWRLPLGLKGWALPVKIPLILPHLAAAFVTLVVWSRSGVVASSAQALGLIQDPAQFPNVLHGGTGLGMILSYVWKQAPFVLVMAGAVLSRLDPDLAAAARMLGASEARIFRQVALPHLRGVLHTAFLILFLYDLGGFDAAFLLSESRPAHLAVEAYNLYFQRSLEDRPQAQALLLAVFAFSLVFIWLYVRLAGRLPERERKL